MIVWTLKTCDTCRKALKWLDENGIDYEQRDVRTDGLDNQTVGHIVGAVGMDKALNKRSKTWRDMVELDKGDLDEPTLLRMIVTNPTLLKRPAFVSENRVLIGFDDEVKAALKG